MRIKKKSEVINFLISQNNYSCYLEIGVNEPSVNFDKIKCPYKDGVDIAGKCNYVMSSDDFFNSIETERVYDIIFIDGLHTCEQVLKDIKNSLKHLVPNGVIVAHDCNPLSKKRQAETGDRGKKWNGTAWKAIVILRMTMPDLMVYVVDISNGMGIIKKGKQDLLKKVSKDKLTYNFLKKNRNKLLNLHSVKRFIKKESNL